MTPRSLTALVPPVPRWADPGVSIPCVLPLDRCAEFPLRVASPALGSTTVKVEFSVLDGVEERRVFGSSCGCVQVLVNGRLGG